MNYKLVNDCVRFKSMDIEMLGNPRKGNLFGLDEEGVSLVNKLIKGCDIQIEKLSESEKQLIEALEKSNQFTHSNEVVESAKAAYFHVTSKCNMNCPGCYSISQRNYDVDLSFNEIKKIIDNLSDANVKSLVISGGEPFLRNDIIDILRYIKQNSKIQYVCCITNGLDDLNRYIDACKYIDELSFSLDGYSKETSYFRKMSHDNVVDVMKKLKDVHSTLSIIFTLHKKNLMYYKKMVDLANILDVNYEFSIFTAPYCEQNKQYILTDEDIMSLNDIIKNDNLLISDTVVTNNIGCRDCCGAGSKLISVSANGNMFPCHMFFEDKFILGNALKDNIDDIYMKNRPMFSVNKKTKCSKCEYQYICGGGCLFRSYLVNGQLEDTDPLCPTYVSHIEKTLSALIG